MGILAVGMVANAIRGEWFVFTVQSLVFFGAGMNLAALWMNGGFMPVFGAPWWWVFGDGEHSVANEETRLPWLCDWIHVPGWRWICPRVVSPGDILLVIAFVFAWASILADFAMWVLARV